MVEELTKKILEFRSEYLEILKSRLNDWEVDDEEEVKRMRSLLRSINKYVNYIEEKLEEEKR